MNLRRAKKSIWIIITTIWTSDVSSLQKYQNIIIGKQYSIDLYDEGKNNNTQDHTPRYDVGMWGNILMHRLHIPICYGGLREQWKRGQHQKGFGWEKW